jgi:hypothetical protein
MLVSGNETSLIRKEYISIFKGFQGGFPKKARFGFSRFFADDPSAGDGPHPRQKPDFPPETCDGRIFVGRLLSTSVDFRSGTW